MPPDGTARGGQALRQAMLRPGRFLAGGCGERPDEALAVDQPGEPARMWGYSYPVRVDSARTRRASQAPTQGRWSSASRSDQADLISPPAR